jgi:hypothetical protein
LLLQPHLKMPLHHPPPPTVHRKEEKAPTIFRVYLSLRHRLEKQWDISQSFINEFAKWKIPS